MNSLRVHAAQLRWRGRACLGRWMERIAAYMPAWVLRLFTGDTRVIVLSCGAGELCAELRPFASGERFLQRATLQEGCWVPDFAWRALRQAERTCPVVLVLPQTVTLSHEIRVPSTALESLEGTIRHGLTTWTPFAHDEVHVSAHPHTIGSSQVVIDLRYALRDQVQELLDTFSEAGFRADRVSLDGRIARAASIDPVKNKRMRRQHVIDGVLFALALAFILASILQVGWGQGSAMTDRQAALPYEASQAQAPTQGRRLP